MSAESELVAEDPTPMMEVWAQDAQEFGIPYDTQKGLIFLTAFALHANYLTNNTDEWIAFTRKLSTKIHREKPHIHTSDVGTFYDQNYSPLLTELAERFLGDDFSPRRIPGASGPYTIWDREGLPDQLPPLIQDDVCGAADWDNAMTSLCSLMGKDIHSDLEGAYLAGFVYFDSCFLLDKEATFKLAQLIDNMMPPKFTWFRHMLNFEPALAAQGNPMQKVLDCFLAGTVHEVPMLYRFVVHFNGHMHYDAPGVKSQEIWDANTWQFTGVVVQQKDWFRAETPETRKELAEVREYLLQSGFNVPPRCEDLRAAAQLVGITILERWGYSLNAAEVQTKADEWTRRCCVVYTCVAFCILNPEWNRFPT